MHTGEPLSPERIAAATAPIIDRIRMTIVRAVGAMEAEVADRLEVPAPLLRMLGMLRNTAPDRVVAVADVLEVFVYQPPDQVQSTIDGLIRVGLAESVADGELRVTTAAQPVMQEVFGQMQSFLDELWSGHAERVEQLLPITQRACAAVPATGGAATRVMAPPYQVPGASASLLLAESLTPLRFHRFDAHTAAWREEGLTVEQVQQLGPGAQRERIEAETNRRAAAPYAVLSEEERFQLCAGLAALPN